MRATCGCKTEPRVSTTQGLATPINYTHNTRVHQEEREVGDLEDGLVGEHHPADEDGKRAVLCHVRLQQGIALGQQGVHQRQHPHASALV